MKMVYKDVARRVVVTGLGSVTPLGKCMESTWKSILNMEEAHSHVMETGHTVYSIPDNYLTTTPNRRISRFVQLALQAGQEALLNSGLLPSNHNHNNNHNHNKDDSSKENDVYYYADRGVSVGCGLSCVEEISMAASMEGSTKRLSPYFVPKVLLNSAAGQLSMKYKYGGPNLAPTTACAAGAHAIMDAYHCIQRGDANVMLAGGTESCLDTISLSGFHRLKALSNSTHACPLDVRRNGFIMSEGASILVLEEYQHAMDRNCTTIYGEMIGYGMTADAHHMTQPNGYGAQRAMSMATSGGTTVDYINAHATSTPVGDVMEVNAISNVFSLTHRNSKPMYVSSTKGATGHLLGAAGALEASLCLLSLRDQIIPPTLHLQQPMPEIIESETNHNIVYPTQPLSTNLQTTLSNSFGFGGTNACLLFQRIG